MLIYNHKKEFLGIDESYLKALGLSSLAELQNEVDDFANLFVKTPGYIHNFKHVHWIDYITCNESGIDSKVIINVKGKNFSTPIEIQTMYLVQNPLEKAYRINLPSIKALTGEQSQKFSADIAKKGTAAAKPAPEVEELYHTPAATESLSTQTSYDPYEADFDEIDSEIEESVSKADLEKSLSLDVEIDEDDFDYTPESDFDEKIETPQKEPAKPIQKIEKEVTESEADNPYANYMYNPQTASEELGLPIDLVEEFIQDFIAQANSFKSDLYESAKDGDLDNLRIQSHKLKGVAANLRVEDALDALTKVNSLEEYSEIKTNLDRLYRIINKLSNTDGTTIEEVNHKESSKDDEDDFILSIKEDAVASTPNIEDSQVPDSIEVPELADDEFLNQASEIKEQSIEKLPSIIEENIETFEDFAQDAINKEASQEKTPDVAFTYDKKQIAHEMGLNIESFNELFDDYVNEAKELSSSMLDYVEKDNLGACKATAVKLRGMSENMRIHDFDDELKAIISSSDDLDSKNLVEKIISKLNLISNYRG
ncbi:Hpt domain-containing protein [Sulfurimonas crateris]|uniref:Hpt domain-containing protein n=1 Tax=Sulfurimonas crateris TaxID=2574727 RepID=A0A4U2ZDB4_9BACT|nr:Hpt domain-containing protein [Sulfurimonas crateris]TKI71221.1 Hpt domain-containing protein [Sulfurimonas crateris]